ncbi:hypothetical protein RRG08_066754 [Elysia crispata]|uniref:Galectin n=1 Tax=Elysia crispata TaxID=231223 RepID=A0AAE0XPR6_9GAST|nr:hypothetical protein RRG08_066754 [Elysia crispata]
MILAFYIVLLSTPSSTTGECYLTPSTLLIQPAGRVKGLTCEDVPWSAVTTIQCAMLCLVRENCTVVSKDCQTGPCQCTLCQGVDDLGDFNSSVLPAEVYIIGRVLAANLTVPPRQTILLPGPVVEGQVFRFLLSLLSTKMVLKLMIDSQFAFLMEIRFWSRNVVRNSLLGGKWGQQEQGVPYFNFTLNQELEVIFVVTRLEYKVYFDSVPFFNFQHREPGLARINILEAYGSGDDIGYLHSAFVSMQ